MRKAAWLILCAGCAFEPRALDVVVGDAGPRAPDAPVVAIDAPVGAIDAPAQPEPDAGGDCRWGYAPTGFDPCDLPPTNGDAVEGVAVTFDTDTGVGTLAGGQTVTPSSRLMEQAGGPSVRVLVFTTFFIDAPIRVVGSHPLLIVGLQSIEIGGAGGLVDVSASGDAPGPGGNDPDACNGGTGGDGHTPTNDVVGGSGGGGGGFGDRGGRGGQSDGAGAGSGGDQNGDASLAPLRGGCGGGLGAPARGIGGGAGAGGGGGGALQISARNSIVLSGHGQIRAAGGGGGAGSGVAGAGGGGSGGAVFLEAPSVIFNPGELFGVRVCANGGSGGEGGGLGGQSAAGMDGSCSELAPASTTNATGGGNGGDGGYRISARGESGGAGGSQGAGGGGGGVGRIRVHSLVGDPQFFGSVVSPTPVVD